MEDKYFEIDSDEKIEDLTLFNNETASFKENFILMMKNAIPAYLSIIFDGITTSLSIAFVGGLNDPIQLAAVGISETLTLLLYYYPVLTNLGAFDTLVSTSYGNKQYRLWGDYLNRALLIMTLFSILPIIGLLFIKDIMTFLEQDPAVLLNLIIKPFKFKHKISNYLKY